jgi:hypothetical protein
MFEILGAITSLVGIGMQAKAQQDQLNLQYAQFNWQKERAVQQDRFAQAGRQDAYGNETYYDRAMNEWKTKLTDMQKSIQQGQEKEQSAQLTKDAPAARKIREQVQQRAHDAIEPYNKAQLAYQYAQPPSEGAIRGDLTKLMATNLMAQSKANQALLMRSAARLGTGAKAEEVINAVDQGLGKQQQNTLLQARNQAVQEAAARAAAHETQYGTPMKMWGELMAQGGNLPDIPKSSLNQDLGNAITNQNEAMQKAFAAGTTGVSSALGGLASAAGKSPDFSGLAKILASIKSGKGTGDDDQSGALNSGGESTYSQNIPGYGYSDNVF